MMLGSWSLFLIGTFSALVSCSAAPSGSRDANKNADPSVLKRTELRSQNTSRIIHVLVALCDNEHQGIVPVPARLGNGEDLERNLYWGAAYGVRSFFRKSADWNLVGQMQIPAPAVLQRCIFRNKTAGVYLIADAYRGAEIKKAIVDFFDYASGGSVEAIDAAGGRGSDSLDERFDGTGVLRAQGCARWMDCK